LPVRRQHFGFVGAVVVNENEVILAGHARRITLREIGWPLEEMQVGSALAM
jgi:hypothetical protein